MSLPVKPRSYICWHTREELCECRKPKPGLVLQAIADAPGRETWMVGDKVTDDQAGKAADARTALVDPVPEGEGDPDWRGPNLETFVRFLGACRGW